MTGPGISEDDDLTIEDLQRSKSELLSGTAFGEAAEKLEEQEEEQASQREALIRKRLLLEAAEKTLGSEDPDVEALRADVHDLSQDLSVEALAAEHVEREEAEKREAAEKIAELESLANTTEGAASASFRKKAEALRAEHGIEADEPNKYSAEALGKTDDSKDAEAVEVLQAIRDRKAVREADAELPEEAQKLISNLKNMREQAKQTGNQALIDRYTEKIQALRHEHA